MKPNFQYHQILRDTFKENYKSSIVSKNDKYAPLLNLCGFELYTGKVGKEAGKIFTYLFGKEWKEQIQNSTDIEIALNPETKEQWRSPEITQLIREFWEYFIPTLNEPTKTE